MAKRDYMLRVECGHDGCRESATFRYEKQRDLAVSHELKNYTNKRWRCVRHTKPEEVLTVQNLERTFEIVSREESHGNYFGNSGFVHGPGFKLWANDFPAGSKLIVTARVILPDSDADRSSESP